MGWFSSDVSEINLYLSNRTIIGKWEVRLRFDGSLLSAGRRGPRQDLQQLLPSLSTIQLSSNNNLQQQTILITDQRAPGCGWGQRPSAAYYSHCSPNDPAGLLRISQWSEQLPRSETCERSFVSMGLELMGKKRKLNFSPKVELFKLELLFAVCVPHHGAFSFRFHFAFFRGLDPTAASSYIATPRDQSEASALSLGGTFPQGKSPSLHLGFCT